MIAIGRLAVAFAAIAVVAHAARTQAAPVASASSAPALPARGRDFSASRVTASVVYIAIDKNGRQVARASGFVIAPGIVVTNAHVAQAGTDFLVVTNGNDGTKALHGAPVFISASDDIAVLRVPELKAPALTIAAGEPAQGVPVWALGYPGDADIASAEDRALVTLTTGTVSRVLTGHTGTSSDSTRLIQHDAGIAPGSSGGPLIDACYRVVGVNAESTGQNLRYMFAIAGSVLPAILAHAGVVPDVSTAGCGDSPPAPRPVDAHNGKVPGDATAAAPASPSPVPAATASAAAAPDDAIARQQQLIDDAHRREEEARLRAAAARAAEAKARAAHDAAEALRQQQIAESAERTAHEQAEYARKLEDQLDQLHASPLVQYWPALAALVGVLLAALAVWVSARQVRRNRQAALLRAGDVERGRAALSERAGRDGVLVGPGGTLMLPGQKLAAGLVLGRSPDGADVLLAKPAVSRRHARFELVAGELFVTDLGSQNGTRINDRPLVANQRERLRDGDRLAFADQRFTLQWTQPKELPHA